MKRLIYIMAILLVSACSSSDVDNNTNLNDPTPTDNTNNWLIPVDEVRDGGPGKDGIPSIDSPKFSETNHESEPLLTDDVLVVGVKIGDDIRAYPHFILDWHEIVNDNVGETPLALTYCPLTGTAIGWNRVIDGTETTFGVSGLLYDNNLIPYDRLTDSNWSQILSLCVNGDQISNRPDIISLVETTWSVWKSMYPQTKVLTVDTGFNRNYDIYPYGDYRTNHDRLIFPIGKDDDRLPKKERVHAVVVNGKSRVYRFNDFEEGVAIKNTYLGASLLIVGDGKTMVSFQLDSSTENLEFSYAFNNSEVFFTDNENNEWNVFGEAISGPRQGQSLKENESFMAYWFSIGTFFPNAAIYNN